MRFPSIAIILLLVGCSNVSTTQKSLAQCHIEASSPTGMEYRREYGIHGNASSQENTVNPDLRGYYDFMLTCMLAKGYKYADVNGIDGKPNKLCWGDGHAAIFVGDGNASSEECFSR